MADIITLEVFSVGAGTKVRYSNDDWVSSSELSPTTSPGPKQYYRLELKKGSNGKPKQTKQSVQLAVEHPGGNGSAALRLFATRGRTGKFCEKRSSVPGPPGMKKLTQRMIGRVIIKDGEIVFRSPDPMDPSKFIKRTRFMESLPSRKKQPNNHKPDSGDSRTFNVQVTQNSLQKISTKVLKAERGLLISHGTLHIALSPGVET